MAVAISTRGPPCAAFLADCHKAESAASDDRQSG
jgi:hypothetical protein